MNVYVDTGLICSLYAPDAHSALAIKRMAKVKGALPFTWLHQLEFRNALRLRVFRGEITAAQRDASLNAWLADRASGVWAVVAPDPSAVALEAERLSAGHAEALGGRSLDILHVAMAVVLGVEGFWTFDHRQQALAAAVGLTE